MQIVWNFKMGFDVYILTFFVWRLSYFLKKNGQFICKSSGYSVRGKRKKKFYNMDVRNAPELAVLSVAATVGLAAENFATSSSTGRRNCPRTTSTSQTPIQPCPTSASSSAPPSRFQCFITHGS
jgi:hypothetical protein